MVEHGSALKAVDGFLVLPLRVGGLLVAELRKELELLLDHLVGLLDFTCELVDIGLNAAVAGGDWVWSVVVLIIVVVLHS